MQGVLEGYSDAEKKTKPAAGGCRHGSAVSSSAAGATAAAAAKEKSPDRRGISQPEAISSARGLQSGGGGGEGSTRTLGALEA